MHDANTGRTYDYTKKGEHGKLVDSGILLPKGAPDKYLDRQTLWNEIDRSETNANARLAREFEVSIPVGLNREQQIEVTKEFCKALANEGMIVDYAIHNPKADNSNPHIHILCSTRPIDEKTGKFSLKEKKVYALDADGNRIPVIDPNTGKQKIGARGRKIWKRTTVQTNPFNAKENIKKWRKQWEIVANNALERAGINSKIDCRSYEERGLNIIPCFGEGAEQYIRERGIDTIRDVRAPNEEIKQINVEVLKGELSEAYEKALFHHEVNYYLDYLDRLVTYDSYIKAPLQLTVVKSNDEIEHDYGLYMAYVGATNKYLKLSFESPKLQTIYDERSSYFKEHPLKEKSHAPGTKDTVPLFLREEIIPKREQSLITVSGTAQSATIAKRFEPKFVYCYAGVVKELPQTARLIAQKSIRLVKDFVANSASFVKRKAVILASAMTAKFKFALTSASRPVKLLPTLNAKSAELMPGPKVKLVASLTATSAQIEFQQVQSNEQVPVSKKTVPVTQYAYVPDTPGQQKPELQQRQPEKAPAITSKSFNLAQFLLELNKQFFGSLYSPLRLRKDVESATNTLDAHSEECVAFVVQNDVLKAHLQDKVSEKSDITEQDVKDASVDVLVECVQQNGIDRHELNVPKYLSCCLAELKTLPNYDVSAQNVLKNDISSTLETHYKEVTKFVLDNSKLRAELQEVRPSFEGADFWTQAEYAVNFVYNKFVEHHEDVELYKPDMQTRRPAQSRGFHR